MIVKSLVGILNLVSLKTKFKRHKLEEFHGYSWAFCPGHCSRSKCARLAGEARRRRKNTEKEDDETRFSPLPGSSL